MERAAGRGANGVRAHGPCQLATRERALLPQRRPDAGEPHTLPPRFGAPARQSIMETAQKDGLKWPPQFGFSLDAGINDKNMMGSPN